MHQVKAHCKRNPNIWQEHEKQSNPLKNVGRDWNNNNGSNLPLNIDRGRQYQIQRLKRDAPDVAIKVINCEMSAKHGSKRKEKDVPGRKRN